jgi:transposase-like protein
MEKTRRPCTFAHVQNRVGPVNRVFIIAADNAPWVTAAGGRRMGGREAGRAEAGDALGAEPAPSADDMAAFRDAARAMLQALDCHRPTQCPACGGSALQRWGKGRSEVQRWRCRGCERSFATTTGTLLARLHAPGKLRLVLLDMLSDEPASCRGLAAKLAVSATTAWAWRQRVNRAFQLITADRPGDAALEAPGSHVATPQATGPGIGPHVAAPDATIDGIVVVRESRKASREWVDHARDPASHPAPDRLRWVDYQEQRLPLPQPMTPYLLPVRLFRDQLGNCGAALVARRAAGAVDPVAAGARWVTEVATSPLASPSSGWSTSGEPTAGAAEPATVRSMRERFATCLRPFCGPARQHLGGYVAWFVARQAAAFETHHRPGVAARAWQAMTTPGPTRFWTCAPAALDAGA